MAMIRKSNSVNRNLRPGLISLCKFLWGKRSFVWVTVGLNLVLCGFVTWLFTDPSTLHKLPVGFLFQNPLYTIIIFITLLSLTCLVGLVAQLPIGILDKEIRQLYLNRMILETKTLALTGIPAGLIA